MNWLLVIKAEGGWQQKHQPLEVETEDRKRTTKTYIHLEKNALEMMMRTTSQMTSGRGGNLWVEKQRMRKVQKNLRT